MGGASGLARGDPLRPARDPPRGSLPHRPCSAPSRSTNRLWHIPFNRVNDELTERLVSGREDIFFGYEFAIQSGQKGLPADVQSHYFDLFSDPDTCAAASGSIARGTPPSRRTNSARRGR